MGQGRPFLMQTTRLQACPYSVWDPSKLGGDRAWSPENKRLVAQHTGAGSSEPSEPHPVRVWVRVRGSIDTLGCSDGKASAYNAGDPGSIPGLGRSSGEGNGNPLQCPCLENPMDGGAL